jgi:hypothetical protein
MDISFLRKDLFAAGRMVIDEAIERLRLNGFSTKQSDMVGPGMKHVKLLGLTLTNNDGRVTWSREEKYPMSLWVRSQFGRHKGS